MSLLSEASARLAEQTSWPYRDGGTAATEPAALAALALMSGGADEPARRALDWLSALQATDGSLGVTATQDAPCWPTSLALLAWKFAERVENTHSEMYRSNIDQAREWLIQAKGDPLPQTDILGHNATLIGWPWVQGTHSWIEPTAWAVLALKACGQGGHPRAREGVRLLIDRLLPTGGANYGNTFVMRQKLRPQIEPTGLAMVALAGERDASGRIDAAGDYLRRTLNEETPSISLSYGILGLAARNQMPTASDQWIARACAQELARECRILNSAWLLLAAQGAASPLITLPAGDAHGRQ